MFLLGHIAASSVQGKRLGRQGRESGTPSIK